MLDQDIQEDIHEETEPSAQEKVPADQSDTQKDTGPSCRICFEGHEAEDMGRLIRPCLCKGSISYIHIKCLETWRRTSSKAFFSCPQCHYNYRFARTRIVGIATNPVVVGTISTIVFVLLTFCSSFLTTYLLSMFRDSSTTFYYSTSSIFYTSPLEVVHDLVKAALRILQDGDEILDSGLFPTEGRRSRTGRPQLVDEDAGVLRRFITRFIIGLPLVGSVSLIHMLLTLPFIGPVHWLARYRGNRRRNRNDTRDITALIILILLAVGAARAFYRLYQIIQVWTTKVLMRLEDSVLEVNV